jgi:hypothetical protein
MTTQGLTYLHPGRRMAEFSQRLAQLWRRLNLAGRSSLRSHRQGVEILAGRLQTLSPLAVLERGYSISRVLPSRQIIREASLLKAGDRVTVRVHRGEFTARVERSGEEEDPQASLTLKSKRLQIADCGFAGIYSATVGTCSGKEFSILDQQSVIV